MKKVALKGREVAIYKFNKWSNRDLFNNDHNFTLKWGRVFKNGPHYHTKWVFVW